MVDDARFRLLKRVTPGSYTFILPARRQVPRRATHRKTIGVRIPGHPAAHALLAELDAPMLSTTFTPAGETLPLSDAQEISARFGRSLELIIDAGPCGTEPSTVIDLTKAQPQVLRKGSGPLAPFSVEPV
jgi:tRNA threonylcarbamoyl adenosine modification protein (Sua5/YciO/YrdC/YwlC family)